MTTYDTDTATPCAAPGCTRPADPVLCRIEVGRLGDMIAELGAMFDRLDAAPSMQGREPDTGGTGGLKSQRSVGDLTVMSLRDHRTAADPDDRLRSVLATLAGWADAVRAERQLTPASVEYRVRRDDRHIGPHCEQCDHGSCAALTFVIAYWVPPTVASERRLLSDHLAWIVRQAWAGDLFEEVLGVWVLLKAATEGRRPRRSAVCACGGRVTVTAMVAECGGCGSKWEGLELARLGAAA